MRRLGARDSEVVLLGALTSHDVARALAGDRARSAQCGFMPGKSTVDAIFMGASLSANRRLTFNFKSQRGSLVSVCLGSSIIKTASSKTDAIFTMRVYFPAGTLQVPEGYVGAFVDFVKAFYTMPREMLLRVLARLGFPPKIADLVRLFHDLEFT